MPRDTAFSTERVHTTCPYCGVGCGLVAAQDVDGEWRIEGDPKHPVNMGRLCSKGAALGETLSLEGRLLHPTIGGNRVSWDEALTTVTTKIQQTIADHSFGSVAFYLSGQLLTEDYYVANKLAKGFLGVSNVDTNSRLCMASSVAGHKRAFGSDTVPQSYEDLDLADLIVLVGSNAAWCHPVLYQRIMANRRQNRAKVVVIDPRRTATADGVDLHLPIAAGSDAILFSGLLIWLAEQDRIDWSYVGTCTEGIDKALVAARAQAGNLTRVAQATGLREADIRKFFELFAGTDRTVTCYSQGVNQSVAGTDKVNAIINCHLATGRIGLPGGGPLSLTGQPNAMGGREVGGLANQLAAHMDFSPETIDRVRRFWNAPNIVTAPGLKTVEMFEAIERGEIKVLWVMASNPAVSLPRADGFRDALAKLDMLIVSDNVVATDTTAHADVLLPAAGWGEKDGTATNSERRVSRQRAFLPLPGEAKPDWWILAEAARRMGFSAAFPYATPADIFREHAALSAFENNGSRDFDIGGLAELTDSEYDTLAPVQWPFAQGQGGSQRRFFSNGGFFTSSGRGRFVPTDEPVPVISDSAFPFVLNTGRLRDQWHTMTRSGKSETLMRHAVEPVLSVHPDDAETVGLKDGGLGRVVSETGGTVLRVAFDDNQQRGTLFAPIHWSGVNSSGGRIGAVVHAVADPISGQPDAKATPVWVEPVAAGIHGFVLTSEPLAMPADAYWACSRAGQGVSYSIILEKPPGEGWSAWMSALLGVEPNALIELSDGITGGYRAAHVADGRLTGCGFFSATGDLPSWEWLKSQLAAADADMDTLTRRSLLAGRPADGAFDPGPIICACFAVGLNEILKTIRQGQLTSPDEIGAALKAGTNCGSCLPELRKIIDEEALVEAD